VVEASPAIILGVRDDGVVALANTAAEHAVGVARGALLGRDVHELVPAGTRPAAWPDGSAELTLRAHDGTERRIEWRFGSADGLHYALGIDVTETRAIERRVRVAEHLAVVGELTAGLAHEIRNPLNSALLELKVLSRRLARLDDPASVASANTVRSELDRLERLLAEFLWFARPRSMAEAAEGDLAHPAAAVARLVQAEAHARNVEVRTDFEATCPTVTFVEDRVRQVVLNLVRNALEALPTGGRISIRTRSVGSRAELSVEDDGPGIEGDPQRVFLPFHTTKSNGTGLGLTIAQRIAADHGGELGVESRPGRTVFTLSIPSRS
jgi:signal transduction histidine kinase